MKCRRRRLESGSPSRLKPELSLRRGGEEDLLGCSFEADVAACTWRVTSNDFQFVVEPISSGYVGAVWICDFIILTAVKQPALFCSGAVVIGAVDVADIAGGMDDGAESAFCVRVVNVLEGLPGYEERIEITGRVGGIYGNLAFIVNSPSYRIGFTLHINARVLLAYLYKAMCHVGGV